MQALKFNKILDYYKFKRQQIRLQSIVSAVFDDKPQGLCAKEIKPVYFLGTKHVSSYKLGGTYPLEALKKMRIKTRERWGVDLGQLHDSILIFVKHGLPDNLEQIKSNRNKIIIDMRDNFIEADGALNPDFAGRDLADVLLFPNQVLLDKFLSIKPTTSKCVVLYGFCDPAITSFFKKQKLNRGDALNCCYFGFNYNVDVSKVEDVKALPKIHMIPLTEFNFDEYVSHLLRFNMHIDYRPINRDSMYKPLTKILIAAQCEANIMIQKSARVLELLPADYPYLIEGDDVAGALRRAQDTYATPQWFQALEVMAKIRREYSFNNHMYSLIEILKELS